MSKERVLTRSNGYSKSTVLYKPLHFMSFLRWVGAKTTKEMWKDCHPGVKPNSLLPSSPCFVGDKVVISRHMPQYCQNNVQYLHLAVNTAGTPGKKGKGYLMG